MRQSARCTWALSVGAHDRSHRPSAVHRHNRRRRWTQWSGVRLPCRSSHSVTPLSQTMPHLQTSHTCSRPSCAVLPTETRRRAVLLCIRRPHAKMQRHARKNAATRTRVWNTGRTLYVHRHQRDAKIPACQCTLMSGPAHLHNGPPITARAKTCARVRTTLNDNHR